MNDIPNSDAMGTRLYLRAKLNLGSCQISTKVREGDYETPETPGIGVILSEAFSSFASWIDTENDPYENDLKLYPVDPKTLE